MSTNEIIILISLGIPVLASLVVLIVALCRGEIKKYIIQCMDEAEVIYKDLEKPEKSIKKLEYVINKVKDKYRLVDLILNVKKFIEYIIEISKGLNSK